MDYVSLVEIIAALVIVLAVSAALFRLGTAVMNRATSVVSLFKTSRTGVESSRSLRRRPAPVRDTVGVIWSNVFVLASRRCSIVGHREKIERWGLVTFVLENNVEVRTESFGCVGLRDTVEEVASGTRQVFFKRAGRSRDSATGDAGREIKAVEGVVVRSLEYW